MLHDVVEVTHHGNHRLRLRFDDGVEGEIDLAPKFQSDAVFAPLKDPRYFGRVRIERDGGTICWPNEADIDPVVLYSWITGRQIPDYEEEA
jgi:hypothetical protein